MYTEDDKDIKVKNKNSNNDYNDFYTSFNNQESKEEKKNKKASKKNETVSKDEDDYSDFYDTNENYEEPKRKDGVKTIIKIGIIIILVVILAILLLVLLNKKKEEAANEIELNKTSYNLKIGDKEFVTYKIVDSSVSITPRFTSSDPSVVIINEKGEITAIGNGKATITVHYTVNGKDKNKKCTVIVGDGNKTVEPTPTTIPTTPPPTIAPTPTETSHELTLNLSASTTNWTNKNVTITVSAKSDTAITSLKYVVNCNGNCTYNDVVNNTITISNNGVNKVTVVAKDQSNKEVTKEITAKIDKEAPTATLTGSSNIVSKSAVNVCVKCSDSLSGCKQAQVCKKYTSSKSNQVITVYDNAGNSKTSQTFNVTISAITQPCSLKVSSDGVVSATLNGAAEYYGFNPDCTGSNELSKKININASKKGESLAKLVKYYIKTKNGNIGSCFITVIKECNCSDPKSTDANCPVTCTFRAN